MSPSGIEIAVLEQQCRQSLERSRRRRVAAEEWRRNRFRRHGGTASVAATGLLVAVGGTGVAGAQSAAGPAGGAQPGTYLLSQDRHSSGDAVALVQKTLEDIPVDGRFGEVTEAKVRRFQRKEGLQVDGIVGPQTRAALGISQPAPVQPAAQPQPAEPAAEAPASKRQAQPEQPQAQEQPAPEPEQAPRSDGDGTGGVQKTPGSSGGQQRSSRSGSSNSTVPAALQQIAQCESGGNPGAIGGNGRYRGKYQFEQGTWESLGGKGDPARAPESEQDRIAAQLYNSSGPGQWPSCGR